MYKRQVLQALEQAHFRPQQLNDEFSKAVYHSYIDALDGSKRIFIQSDIDQLKGYITKLDDDIKVRNLDFFYLSTKLFRNALIKSETYYKEAVSKPLDLKANHTIELDPKKSNFAKNDADLKLSLIHI